MLDRYYVALRLRVALPSMLVCLFFILWIDLWSLLVNEKIFYECYIANTPVNLFIALDKIKKNRVVDSCIES